MNWLELTAVVFSFICIVLAVYKHPLNWPIGIIGVTAYFFLFFKEKLYADMCLQIVYIVQGFYGWCLWKNKSTNTSNFEVLSLTQRELFYYSLLLLLLCISWYFILINFTDASLPLYDAAATSISLVANILMAKRKIENWLLWIFVDCIYIGLFYYKELFLSSFIYFIFLLLSIKGWMDWQKSLTKKDSH